MGGARNADDKTIRDVALVGDVARSVAASLYQDGVTSGAGIHTSLGVPGDGIGASNVKKVFYYLGRVPTDSVLSNRCVCYLGSSPATAFAGNWSCNLHIYGDSFYFQVVNGATNTFARIAIWPFSRQRWAGQIILAVATWDGTNAPTLEINGELQYTGTEVTAGGGSAPAWTQAVDDDWFVVGHRSAADLYRGEIFDYGICNASITAAEQLEWVRSGLKPLWMRLETGSMARFVTDFSSATGMTPTGSTTISGGKLNLSIGDSLFFAQLIQRFCKYSFTVTIDSITAGNVSYFDGSVYISFATAPGTYTVEFTALGTYTGGPALRSVGGNAVLDAYSFRSFGTLFEHDQDPNYGARDKRPNALHGYRTPGSLYQGPKLDSNTSFAFSNATGAQADLRLPGTSLSAFDTSKDWVIEGWAVYSNAVVNLSLGNASGGAQYVSAFALAVGINYITDANLVTKLLAGADLYARVSGNVIGTVTPILRRVSR